MSKATQMSISASLEKLQKVQQLTNPPRISDTEKAQLQSVFGMDAPIYIALRDCFYGFELTEDQKAELARVKPVIGLVRRVFLPELGKGVAFGQNYDLWQTQDVKNANIDSFETFAAAKWILLDMLEVSLKRVEDPDLSGIDLSIKKDSEYPFVLARNGYISYIDSQIRFLMQYAIQNTLTESEMRAVLQQNSLK